LTAKRKLNFKARKRSKMKIWILFLCATVFSSERYENVKNLDVVEPEQTLVQRNKKTFILIGVHGLTQAALFTFLMYKAAELIGLNEMQMKLLLFTDLSVQIFCIIVLILGVQHLALSGIVFYKWVQFLRNMFSKPLLVSQFVFLILLSIYVGYVSLSGLSKLF
jgi:hypothetical protein